MALYMGNKKITPELYLRDKGIPRVITQAGVYQISDNLSTFSLPSITTGIGDYALSYAFYDCNSLTSVNLSSLTSISGECALCNAFAGCTSLTSVNLNSLTSLTGSFALENAFTLCTELKTLSFPSLTSLGSNTNQFHNMLYFVEGCEVHFPSNLQQVIGSWSDTVSGFGGTNTVVLFDLLATA